MSINRLKALSIAHVKNLPGYLQGRTVVPGTVTAGQYIALTTAPNTYNQFFLEPLRDTESYGYGVKIDSDLLFMGGAAKKEYMMKISGDKTGASTGDSNGALLSVQGGNHALNDSNYIFRGINVGINNDDAGTLGRLENFIGSQNKNDGGTIPIVLGCTILAENYNTTNSTEIGAIDAILRDEDGSATTAFGIRIRNDDRSSITAPEAALLITSHSSSGGWETLIDMVGATPTTNAFSFKDDGTVCHDTDTGSGTDFQFSDFNGYLTVLVGTATRYIGLLASKPSSLS